MPTGTGQDTAANGIFRNKQLQQIIRFDFLQLGAGEFGIHFHALQSVNCFDRSAELLYQAGRHIVGKAHTHLDYAVFRHNVCSGNDRLRKGLTEVFRRFIIREHIQKEYGIFHFFLL